MDAERQYRNGRCGNQVAACALPGFSPHRHSADQSCVETENGSCAYRCTRETTQGRACLEQTRRSTGGGKAVSHLSGRRFGQGKGSGAGDDPGKSREPKVGRAPRIRRRTDESTRRNGRGPSRVGADDAEVRSEAAGRGVRKAHGSAKSSAGRGVRSERVSA